MATISIQLTMPDPQKSKKQAAGIPIETKIKDAIDLIDSGYKSTVEWNMLKRFYGALSKLEKPSDKAKSLMAMIEPVLAKNGYHKQI